METLLQKWLRAGGKIEELLTKYAVKAKRHPKYPQLVQFKYDMIGSPMGDPMVQECRGIILDEQDNWRVVARPFDKFFNYGEGHAKPLDWASARVQEKLDGSLMILYHYDGAWHVASSGTPDAGGEVNGCGFTFAELFWRVWDEEGYRRPFSFHQHKTYLYELMTPYNRVVVRHKANRLIMIGLRNRETGEEDPIGVDKDDTFNETNGLQSEVRVFPLQTTEDVVKTFEAMDPLAQEGYVVVDKHFNRVKVKHPGYVAIHHMRDGFGPRRMLEVVRTGEHSELLAHFPEWKPVHDDVEQRFNALVTVLKEAYEKHHAEPSQKEFALKIKEIPFNGALFMLRAGKTPSIREYLREANLKHLADYLKIKDIEF